MIAETWSPFSVTGLDKHIGSG